jgi:hypothetical protein
MVANAQEAISLLGEGQLILLPVPPPAPTVPEQGQFTSSAA